MLARNALCDVERLYETGGIKTHNNVRCLLRRNLVVDTRHGSGIWLDWNIQFSRCTQNVIIGASTIHGRSSSKPRTFRDRLSGIKR